MIQQERLKMNKYWNYLLKVFDFNSGATIYERTFDDLYLVEKYIADKRISSYIVLDLLIPVGCHGFRIVKFNK